MREFIDYLKDLVNDALQQNKQGIPCKIVSFDQSVMRASVQPLFKIQNGEDDPIDYPQIDDVLVGFLFAGGKTFIKPDYQVDDLVWVSFSTHDIDEARDGVSSTESDDINNLSNCIITHGYVPDEWTAPANWLTEGLVLGDDKVTIQILDGQIQFKNADSELTFFEKTLKYLNDTTELSVVEKALTYDNGSGTIEMDNTGKFSVNGTNLEVDP